ncbi:MAG: DUF1501 domain-containing protein [Armatimonadetes bacterium]|nr:DUF1501 domain-containing protein [Armatimonadota bacterium]
MSEQQHQNACEEYRKMSRRKFIGGTAAVAASMSIPVWMPRIAFAQPGGESSNRDVVLSIYLRGGADGLSMVVPHGDPLYYNKRPNIAVPDPSSGDSNRVVDIDGYFGLCGAMGSLKSVYDGGDLAIVHAVGRDNWTRSHFDAQRQMERGQDDGINVGGWLGRHLATIAPLNASNVVRALTFSSGMPLIAQGGPGVVSALKPETLELNGHFTNESEVQNILFRQYLEKNDLTREVVKNAKMTVDLVQLLNLDGYVTSGTPFSNTQFGKSMQSASAIIGADAGIEAMHIDLYGWDTHAEQGTMNGTLDDLMSDLGDNLMALHSDLTARNKTNWVVVVISEFGRQFAENGSLGTDHGSGNAMFLMGPGVKGGKIVTHWPGLEVENLKDGVDLNPTIDYRNVLYDLVEKRLKNGNMPDVFPDFGLTENLDLFEAA